MFDDFDRGIEEQRCIAERLDRERYEKQLLRSRGGGGFGFGNVLLFILGAILLLGFLGFGGGH